MTPDQAIATLKALNAEARSGWPNGFNHGAILATAFPAIEALAAAVDAAPEAAQQILARTFVKRLASFEATVKPKKRASP